MILSGSSNPELSEEVAARIGTKLGACRVGVGCKFDGRPDMLLMGKSSSKKRMAVSLRLTGRISISL